MMTTTTTRITKLSFTLLTSAILVLSSIAAAQLLTANSNIVAFAAGNCKSTETDGILEETCSGGGAHAPPSEEFEGTGGTGFHTTCTTDLSTETETRTCTFSGGSGSGGEGTGTGGGGGRSTCTFDDSTGEQSCSFEVGRR